MGCVDVWPQTRPRILSNTFKCSITTEPTTSREEIKETDDLRTDEGVDFFVDKSRPQKIQKTIDEYRVVCKNDEGTDSLLEDLFGQEVDPADREDENFTCLANSLQGFEGKRLLQQFNDSGKKGTVRTDVSNVFNILFCLCLPLLIGLYTV